MTGEQLFENRIDLSEVSRAVNSIRQQMEKVIIGQQQMVDLLMIGLLCDGHILIEGVPGVAKTLTAKLLAKIVDVKFTRIQFTPDLMPSDVLGTTIFNPRQGDFQFKPGPIFSNIVLIDEINRAPAKTQSALFEVMEEKQVTIDGVTHQLDFPFVVLATQNPIEQEGTYRLPEAQLDRFLFKINVNYPTLQEEIMILNAQHAQSQSTLVDQVDTVLSAEQIAIFRQTILNIMIEPNLIEFIASIVNETRDNASLYLGASPRASLAIMRASKANAGLKGRDFVTPDDIIEMAAPVMRHRIILTPEKEMEGLTPDELIESIISKIEVPR